MTFVVPLTFALSAPAWGEDCGIAPGDRWWFAAGGLLICDTDGRVVDAKACDIPAGVTLSVRVTDVSPPTVLTIVPPCGDDTFVAREGAKARGYLEARGVREVEVVVAPCGAKPSITATVKGGGGGGT